VQSVVRVGNELGSDKSLGPFSKLVGDLVSRSYLPGFVKLLPSLHSGFGIKFFTILCD